MAKGTKKVITRTATATRRRTNPFTTRNLRNALMNIHKNIIAAEGIIDKKIGNTHTLAPRASKMRYLNTLKAERNIKEQLKTKRQALKKNIDDITMMMSKL